MKNFKTFIILSFFMLSMSCERKPAEIITGGDIKVSELVDKTNYNLPLTMQNDRNATVYLNGTEVVFENYLHDFEEAGFYHMVVYGNPKIDICFCILDPERGETEWGLKKWVPVEPMVEEPGSEVFQALYPKNLVAGINIPILIKAENTKSVLGRYFKAENNSGESFLVKNGVGSQNISSDVFQWTQIDLGTQTFQPECVANYSEPITLSYTGTTISDTLEIPANSVLQITTDIKIQSSGKLSIGPGTIITIDEGINIFNYGEIEFLGTSDNPVLVTCSNPDGYWGGFISSGTASGLTADHTFFTQSGYNDTGEFVLGHAQRQALFQSSGGTILLQYCYMLDHIGQIFYPVNTKFDIYNCVVQRAKTSGQLNYSQVTINNCVFTDFPNDNNTFQDEDNDALYINACDATVRNSVFAFTKDDGIDSGGSEGGTVTVDSCRFESCFHEGAALSSGSPAVKTHIFTNSTFTNNGQGLELGYSSENHIVQIDNCLFEANHIGIRYGDNYPWDINGNVLVENSRSINNDKDVWNMVRQIWEPKIENMQFNNTYISKPSTQYPDLQIFQP